MTLWDNLKDPIQKLLEAGHKPSIKVYPHIGSAIYLGTHSLYVGYSGIYLRDDDKGECLLEFDPKHPLSDKTYWKNIRQNIFKLLPEKYSNVADALWKKVKYYRLLQYSKHWEEVLPKDIAEWAWGVLNSVSREDDCVDNTRVARLGSSPQMRRYQRQKGRGCCGFNDFQRRGPDGNMYALGYNYGH